MAAPANLIINPKSGTNTTGYQLVAGTLSRSTTLSSGTWGTTTGAIATCNSTASGYFAIGPANYNAGSVITGIDFSWTVEFAVSATDSTMVVYFYEYNSSTTFVTSAALGTYSVSANGPVTATGIYTPTGSNTTQLLILVVCGTPVVNKTITVTRIRLDRIYNPYLEYADGDTTNWSWSGTSNASQSNNTVISNGISSKDNSASSSDNSNLDMGVRLGMDAGTLTDTSNLVVSVVSSDTAIQSETRSNQYSTIISDTALFSEATNSTATMSSSDTASETESSNLNTNVQKLGSELAAFNESSTVFAFVQTSDTATQNDSKYSSHTSSDSFSITDSQLTRLLVNELFALNESRNPQFNYLWTADTFSLLDTGAGGKQFGTSDIFSFIEEAHYTEQISQREDLISYPDTYWGGSRTRIIAQDHFTREILHWDLPLDNLQITFTLSGPNLLEATLTTEISSIPTLTPDRTWLHVEDNGQIIASFILTPFIDNPEDQTRTIEGEGFSTYPHWIIYEDSAYTGVQVDPADMVRKLWDHCQSYPDGNLGVRVWNTSTPVRIGYPSENVSFTTTAGNQVQFQAGPYTLNYWSVTNCGDEIDKLCKETPLEYWEFSRWNDTKSDIEHYLVLGYPRVGSKRTDLNFREGENLESLIPSYQESQDNYASDVFVIGAGNGPTAVRARHSERIGRLRKTNVIQDQSIGSISRAQKVADFEFKRLSQSRFLIESVTIDTTHLNALWGTFIAGDDIFLQCTVPYVGYVQDWYRITSYVYSPYQQTAELSLSPSDSFSYGAETVDPYLDLPKEGYAVLSNVSVSSDDVNAQAIYRAQYAAIQWFNNHNVLNSQALAYRSDDSSGRYYLISIQQVITPYVFIIGRNDQGNLLTGDNVVLITKDGTIGQAANSTGTDANSTNIPESNPNDPGLCAAALETNNAYVSNIPMDEGLRWAGMSQNARYWNPQLSQIFYSYGGSYAGNKPSSNLPQIMGRIISGTASYGGT